MNNFDFNVDDFINSVENDNKNEIELNTFAMKYHINTVFKELVIACLHSKMINIIQKYNPNKVLYATHIANIKIINEEEKIAAFLYNNLEYLYNIDDKNKAIALIKIYYYLILTDLDRIEFININSNKGRTIIASYLLDEINNNLDIIIENLEIYGKDDNILIKEVKNGK